MRPPGSGTSGGLTGGSAGVGGSAGAGGVAAVREIVALSARQFDPQIVEVFRDREAMLRRCYYEFAS